ncbi:Probable F-box protein [Striga hermonthica]|uniref:Probable F-box protein n=1 Tax=Striga hermonthica TaxID=68872 RepID=A0A9N7NQZ6_STRHE|nr:Probable F-box protein [Striga hermonthica]
MAALKSSALLLNPSTRDRSSYSSNSTDSKQKTNIPKSNTIRKIPGLLAPRSSYSTNLKQKTSITKLNTVPKIPLSGHLTTERRPASPLTTTNKTVTTKTETGEKPDPTVVAKLYAIIEAVADRVEMHRNIADQRNNWNTLMLTSINSLTLTAAVITASGSRAVAAAAMYLAAAGMLSVVNKIQPSQLGEEQRNAARLFEQLGNQIRTVVSIGNPTTENVREMTEKVMALDQAYPLPLLGGAMIEKFPGRVEPAVWWPPQKEEEKNRGKSGRLPGPNGWDGKLEEEMRGIGKLIGKRDKAEYVRLGEKALRLNRALAAGGVALTGMAADNCTSTLP